MYIYILLSNESLESLFLTQLSKHVSTVRHSDTQLKFRRALRNLSRGGKKKADFCLIIVLKVSSTFKKSLKNQPI